MTHDPASDPVGDDPAGQDQVNAEAVDDEPMVGVEEFTPTSDADPADAGVQTARTRRPPAGPPRRRPTLFTPTRWSPPSGWATCSGSRRSTSTTSAASTATAP